MAIHREDSALRDYAAFLTRYRWLLLLSVAASLAVALAYVSGASAEYECSLRLLGDNTSRTYVRTDTDDPFNDATSLAGHDVTTQVEILQSGEFLQAASRLAGVPKDNVRIEAKRVFDTDVIGVRVLSSSAQQAEQLGRVLPTAYERFVVATKTRAIRSALPYAKNRLQRESHLLAAAELALQKLKDRSHIVDLDKQRESLIASASDAATDLRKTQMQVSGTQQQLTTVKHLLASQPATVKTPVSTTNPSIAELRDRIADLRNERARMTVLYKPNDTRMQEIDAQVRELTRRLNRLQPMVTTVTRSRNPAVAQYQDQVAGLQATLADQRGELAQARAGYQKTVATLKRFNALEREQARLNREIDQHRTSVGLLSASVADLTIRADTARDPTGTLTEASAATKVWPKTGNILGAAGMFGLLLGLCIAALMDQFDPRIRLDRDMRGLKGSPVLGFLPPTGRLGPARFAADPSELNSYRVLAMNLTFADGGGRPGSILLCRTNDNEDTLPTAVNLAIAMAEAGRTTILVDADTHAPGLHRDLGKEEAPGLTDVLRDDATLERALQAGPVPGLSVLTAGTAGAAAWLVNPALTRRLDDELRSHADCVIYHGPPVLVAAEALQLAAAADAVAYVITEGRTRLPELVQAAGLLAGVHANVLGFAIHSAHSRAGRNGRAGAGSPTPLRAPSSLLRLWQRPSSGRAREQRPSSGRAREEIAPSRAMPECGGTELAKGGNDL